MNAKHTPTQFGNVIGGDFSNDTLTIEMEPRFTVSAGPVAVVPQPVYGALLDAARCAENVLTLLAAEVQALGHKAPNVREKLRAAIEKATGDKA
jgi:hypothetical protein